MSCLLEFLSINLDDVQRFFENGDNAIRDLIIAQGDDLYDSDDDEEKQEDRFVWKEIVNSLSGGKLGKYMASQSRYGVEGNRTDSVSQMKAFAISAVFNHYGKSFGGVQHSYGGGAIFRSQTFDYLNQTSFLNSLDSNFLLDRPIFNQLHPTFPSWGGFSKNELSSIPIDKLQSARPDSGDSDIDGWVSDILTLIEEVKLQELDLVTIYE